MAEQKPNVVPKQPKAEKPKTPPKSRRQRFLDLAPKRTDRAINAIRQVANCSVPTGYEYTSEEAAKIVNALIEAVNRCKQRFLEPKQSKQRFTL